MKTKIIAILASLGLLSLFMLVPRIAEGDNNNKIVDIPDVSGVVYNMPWAKNKEFVKALEESGASVLMAGFCAVLNNPSPAEESNVHLAAKSIKGTVVAPGEVFSQNKTIGPYTAEKGYKEGQAFLGSEVQGSVGGGVCKIATSLYNTSVLCNLDIIERHNHFMPVTYVPLGQDATVSFGSKDLRFKNTTDSPILIWAQGIGNRVYMGFYGKEKPPAITWDHKVLNKIKAPVEYKTNPKLEKGEEKIIVEGLDGAAIESRVTITDPDGQSTTKHMGISQYWPMAHQIERN